MKNGQVVSPSIPQLPDYTIAKFMKTACRRSYIFLLGVSIVSVNKNSYIKSLILRMYCEQESLLNVTQLATLA